MMKTFSAAAVVFLAGLAVPGVPDGEIVPHYGYSVEQEGIGEECATCHDGSIAQHVVLCTANCLLAGAHSVGTLYPPSGEHRGFASRASAEARGIRFFDGRVGCVSCHDLLSPTRYHLVMRNDRSQLCQACHIKWPETRAGTGLEIRVV